MIETEVEGSPEAISSVAHWLRSTLKSNVEGAAERQVTARHNASRMWEGETADAYQGFTKPLLRATDEHAPRIGRAADALDDLSRRLRRELEDREHLRGRASSGGLTLSGTRIERPADLPSQSFSPGSAEETAYNDALAKINLFNALSDEVLIADQNYRDWVETNMTMAADDAAERTDLWKVIKNIAQDFAIGIGGLSLLSRAKDFAELERQVKRSRHPKFESERKKNPRGTRLKAAKLGRISRWLSRGGRSAPFIGPVIGVGLGAYDVWVVKKPWQRVVLTTVAGIGVGALAAMAVPSAIATAPVWGPVAVVTASAVAGAAAAEGVGWAYDHREQIGEGIRSGAETARDWADEKRADLEELAEDTWETVTPW